MRFVLSILAICFLLVLGNKMFDRPASLPAPRPVAVGTPMPAAFASDVKGSQHAAVQKFPELGVAGSPLNKMFVNEYERQRAAGSRYLDSSDWPMWLANQCVARLNDPSLSPVPIDPKPPQFDVEPIPLPTPRPTPIYVRIESARAVAAEYDRNQVDAEMRRKFKVAILQGIITDIGVDISGNPYVVLDADEYGAGGVQCSFAKDQRALVARYTKGQTVRLAGILGGKFFRVQMSDCEPD